MSDTDPNPHASELGKRRWLGKSKEQVKDAMLLARLTKDFRRKHPGASPEFVSANVQLLFQNRKSKE